jgi:hypothetical protein
MSGFEKRQLFKIHLHALVNLLTVLCSCFTVPTRMHFKSGTAFPGPSQAQGWRLMPWLLWKLCTIPHSNYPNDVAFDFIKKAVWRYDHLPEREFWKFGYDSSRFRKVLEPSQNCFGMLSK